MGYYIPPQYLHAPPRGTIVHRMTLAQIQAICPGDLACTWPKQPGVTRCIVVLPTRLPPGGPSMREVTSHEFAHCNGYVHP